MENGRKLKIGLGIAAILLFVPALTLGTLTFALPNVYSASFYAELGDKVKLLEEKKENRIVIIGGSSVPFALDCSLIKQELPEHNPVDFGLYAAFGTTMMLDLAKGDIQKGDIVIISPEQSRQTLSMYFNAKEAWKAFESCPSSVFKLNIESKKSLIANAPGYVGEKVSFLSSGSLPDPAGIYRHDSFNEYGDVKADRPANILPDGVDPNSPISFNTSIIEKDFIDYLNAFGKTVWEKGAHPYYRFSPMNEAAIIGNESLDAYYDYLDSSLVFPILGNPHNSVLAKEWFYDTNYHLNSSGAKKFTKGLIQDIKLLLKDTSKTNIEDPLMPKLPDPTYYQGDDSDEGCFLYEKEGDGLIAVALSQEGQSKRSLIVPTFHDGKPVLGIGANVFKGNQSIEEVTLQPNIKSILDYSFENSKIKRIVLQAEDPSATMVGSHLLDGCEAEIYVKESVLNDYLLSYFWAAYGHRIKAYS